MNEIASKGQLRLSYLRWALFVVPAIVFLGFLMSRISNAGFGNLWFDTLVKPSIMPPGLAFPIVWSILYVLMGLALSVVLDARGAKGRGVAVLLFLAQLACNLAWSPLFFASHKVTAALYLIILMLILATATTLAFRRIRRIAAWLMVPYLCWLGIACGLNYEIRRLNPDAETLVAPTLRTQI
ncbi:TspO/MBR family protein [Sphingobium sp. BS19]|uniref:TspO/MBR family protein n=1 Tax=Sphingobium sp. BS19 TaxID=3018973 RepID=UPI0022EF086E|nr:TspO/MBR family protein [Sphingobium sp. BS19]GLI96764.1 hypothetical protein Sbs19_05820 [Sphingobium sp. BS19]